MFLTGLWKIVIFSGGIIAGLITYIFLETKTALADLSNEVNKLNNSIAISSANIINIEKQVERNTRKVDALEERIYRGRK